MTTLVLSILNRSSSFLHTIRTPIKAWMSLIFRQDLVTYFRVSSPQASKKLRDNVVTALVSTFLIGSSSLFHLTWTNKKAWMSLNFK